MLAYEMNGAALSYGLGAPLRLRNEVSIQDPKFLALCMDVRPVGTGPA